MEKEFSLIQDFVRNLEANKLNAEQQAILLVGDETDIFGCGNGTCTNESPGCSSADNGKCTNSKACSDSPNTSNCSCNSNTSGCGITNTNCPCVSKDTACTDNNTQGCSAKPLGFIGFPGFDI